MGTMFCSQPCAGLIHPQERYVSFGQVGFPAKEAKCVKEGQNSTGGVTALNPYSGYDHATAIAKKALETGQSVYKLVLEEGILTKEDLDTILNPKNMVRPVKLDIHAKG